MKTSPLMLVGLAVLALPSWVGAGPDPAAKLTFIDGPVLGSSLAVVVDEAPLVHTSQIWPIDVEGKAIAEGDATKQAEAVLARLERTLGGVSSSLARVVKLNICLSTAAAMPQVQAVLDRTFSERRKPAVTFVVGDLARLGASVAMDAVALSSAEADSVKWFASETKKSDGIADASILPAGPKLYVSGMADTNSLLPATRKTLEKLVSAISHLGSTREDIVQLKVFFQPMSDFEQVRKVVSDFFGGKAPPTVFVEWISANPVVEIELIAAARGDKTDTNTVSFFTPPGTTDSKVYRRVARVNSGKLIFVSGLYGTNSQDGAGQVREIFETLRSVCEKTGTDFQHLVKATYCVTDNDASNKLNDLRPQYYNPQRAPAASKVKVKGVGAPGKTVMMDMIVATK